MAVRNKTPLLDATESNTILKQTICCALNVSNGTFCYGFYPSGLTLHEQSLYVLPHN